MAEMEIDKALWVSSAKRQSDREVTMVQMAMRLNIRWLVKQDSGVIDVQGSYTIRRPTLKRVNNVDWDWFQHKETRCHTSWSLATSKDNFALVNNSSNDNKIKFLTGHENWIHHVVVIVSISLLFWRQKVMGFSRPSINIPLQSRIFVVWSFVGPALSDTTSCSNRIKQSRGNKHRQHIFA